MFDADGLRAEKYIGDGLRLFVLFPRTELAFRRGALFVADRSQHLQPQIESSGVVSLLRQQYGEKEHTNGALGEEEGAGMGRGFTDWGEFVRIMTFTIRCANDWVACRMYMDDVACPVARERQGVVLRAAPPRSEPKALGFCTLTRRRGSQVVRQRSAKPLFVGSIPTHASKNILSFNHRWEDDFIYVSGNPSHPRLQENEHRRMFVLRYEGVRVNWEDEACIDQIGIDGGDLAFGSWVFDVAAGDGEVEADDGAELRSHTASVWVWD